MWSGGRIGNSETNGDRTFVQFARRSRPTGGRCARKKDGWTGTALHAQVNERDPLASAPTKDTRLKGHERSCGGVRSQRPGWQRAVRGRRNGRRRRMSSSPASGPNHCAVT